MTRYTHGTFALTTILLSVALLGVEYGSAFAQGKLDARYSVTLAGLSIGRGSWVINIGEDEFSATANGTTAGLMHVFASGQGYSSVHGTIAAGQLAPAVYTTSIRTGQEEYEVRMVFSGGNVIDFAAQPPNAPSPDRIPLSEIDRQGVSDPMTASLVWVPGKGDTVAPQACERIVSIFEGHMRYDLQLAFRRIERVKSRIGYEGPVVVCSMHFEPIAGHIPDRYAISYLAELREYRAVPCADCGDPRFGALSLLSADTARNGDHAGGSIRLHLSIEPVLAAPTARRVAS